MRTPRTIFFSDIDGTLLDADRQISVALSAQVQRLSDHPFILISSRMPAGMTHLQTDLGIANTPLIAYNGGLVLAAGKTIHSQAIDLEVAHHIHRLARHPELSVQLFHGDEWYVEEMDHYAQREARNTRVTPAVRPADTTLADWTDRAIGPHKVMVMGTPEVLDRLVSALEQHFAEVLHLYRSKDTYLEIADRRISKLTGITALLATSYPERLLADCVAFGDNYNDIEMLSGVGVGVAVANARPEVLAVANAITDHNKADGVANWLATIA